MNQTNLTLNNETLVMLIDTRQAFRRASWANPNFALRYKSLLPSGYLLCVDTEIWTPYSLTKEDQNAHDWMIL